MDESVEDINRTPSGKKRKIEGDAAGGKAKLTNSQKMEILNLLELGESQASIARKYQVSAVTISKINKAKSILIERIPLSNPNSKRISLSASKKTRDNDISFEAENDESEEENSDDEEEILEDSENKEDKDECEEEPSAKKEEDNKNKKHEEDSKKIEEMTIKMKEIYDFMASYDQTYANGIENIFNTMIKKYFPEKKI